MSTTIVPMTADFRKPVIDIFNYYIENGFAAFLQQKLPYEAFDMLAKMCEKHGAVVALDDNAKVLGFGLLHAYNPMPPYAHTAEVGYFLAPDETGKQIGSQILNSLIAKASELGVRELIATIAASNAHSIRFHEKNGFVQRGILEKIARKNGINFDIVIMQRSLQ